MNQTELQKLVEEISLTNFSKPFLHKATFNARLKTTGGRYLLKTHDLDFNERVLEMYGIDDFVKVIIHELCHYHLHLEGRGYRHRDADSNSLLGATGGSRYVKDLRTPEERQSLHQYRCVKCAAEIS
ncbi:SprT family protein, partial [Jeotgalibaca porci]|uniref:SprT family protein n=1 Tax=Jeotgalibaca porci TaxID=1868793 RepID=UPI0035A09736